MNAAVELLGATLLHFLWQGCLIALALLLALRYCGSARRRYLLGLAALALMAVTPISTALWISRDQPSTLNFTPVVPPPTPAPLALPLPSPSVGSEFRPGGRPHLIVGLWLAGVLSLTVYNAGGWFRLQRLRGEGSCIAEWEERVAKLCRLVGVGHPVRLIASSAVDVPLVIGWLKPAVLLPASALTGMSTLALEALILHELAHIRRRDYLVNLLQVALETLLFYHPAVWWVSRLVRLEREHLCDDLAAGLCRRRADYMQALAELEQRRLSPTLAVAADGGSLMSRIRRLTGNTQPAGARWTLGVGALTVVALSIALVPVVATPAVTAQTSEALEGEWRSETKPTHVQLELRMGQHHRNSLWLERSELQKTSTGYVLVRDAGTIDLVGELDSGWSGFVFRPNPDYPVQMGRFGYDVTASPRRLFEMASLDVSLDFARGIAAAGYDDIPTSRLIAFRIHGVTRDFIEGITAAGLDDLSPGRLVEFRIHGVTPDFVQAMNDAGYRDLSSGRLVEFRIHGVSPEFVAGMADAGLEDLTAGRLVEFRIHGVNPEFVREMADSGLRDLSASKLVEFRIHGISGDFVREITALVSDLTPSRLVEFRIHSVTPEFVRRAQAQRGADLTASELVSMRIHGWGR